MIEADIPDQSPAGSAPRSPKPTQLDAYVFTTSPAVPEARPAIERARQLWPAMPPLTSLDKGDGTALLVAGADEPGVSGGIRHVTTKFPIALLAKAASHAIGWPTVNRDLAAHTAHIVVSVTHPDPLAAHMLLSHLTASVLEQTKGSGVYWVNSGALIPAAGFLAQCLKTAEGNVPAMLWTKVGFARGRSDAGEPRMLAYTTGLASFGLLDLECICTAEQLRSPMLGFMYGVASGSITRREQPRDGTGTRIGAPGVATVSFHRAPSRRRPANQAIRLVIHAEDPPEKAALPL